MDQDGIWLSILDYTRAKKTSISTIRRSIKSGHLKYKIENGKYFIFTKNLTIDYFSEKNELAARLELELTRKKNRILQEEVNDLKMLLSIYENQNHNELPSIPEKSL